MFDPKICVSGAAGGEASKDGSRLAYEVGREIAIHGGIVITGATKGVPLSAARGAKSVKGEVLGFSPAHTLKEHIGKYRLPVQYMDNIFFTGYEYAGRDSLLIDLSDAVIQVSGRIGTLHEFTTAFERNKIVGVLLESGGLAEDLPYILEKAERGHRRVLFHADPRELVRDVFKAIETNAQN